MCGRFTIYTPAAVLCKRFNADFEESFQPNYNAAPSQNLPVITNSVPEKIQLLHWGLIPSWAKDANVGYKMINARVETVDTTPAYKNSFAEKRCLVLADGFYEWSHTGAKKLYRITLKNEEPFAMAGIWTTWNNPEGKEVRSFSIITTNANTLVAKLHDRMPVILERKDEKKWLTAPTLEVLKQYNPAEMKYYEVSGKVNSAANNSPALVKPVEQRTL